MSLYEIFIEPFEDGLCGIIVGVFIWLCALFVLFIVGYGSFIAIDSFNENKMQGYGIVVDKHHTSAYVSNVTVISGKSVIVVPTYYPEQWNVTVEIDKIKDSKSITQEQYQSLEIGQSVYCIYSKGRFSKAIYIYELFGKK
jgi:hypothetical protein